MTTFGKILAGLAGAGLAFLIKRYYQNKKKREYYRYY